MTAAVSTDVLLVCGYSVFLLAVAYGFDVMARRVAVRARQWRTGSFRYHADHDAWICPQDQWLWPTSYDPEQRIVRYRGKPAVCNACPVKSGCTTSPHGREVTREIDPWPHSEAGRFHRGIACLVALIGPLARHLWRTPSGFPEHIPQQAVYEEPPRDRFATRWGSARNRTTSREL